jgi:hypothetical protein
MTTEALLKFRADLAWIANTGDIAHDKYLINLKKLIDEEILKPNPDTIKIMNYICMNRMKFEIKGIE